MEKQGVGLVVGIIDEQGTRVLSYGVADKKAAKNVDGDSIFEIGSVTKLFTSLILADMVEKGEVKLTDPVAMYLPKYVKIPGRNGKQITLFDLANHLSSLPAWPSNLVSKDRLNPVADYTVEQMYEFLSSYQLTRDIGEKKEYSNVGVGLLGHVLSLRAGQVYERLVQTRITEPLGMTDTAITLSPRMKENLAKPHDASGVSMKNWDLPAIPGAGALRSTVNDMLKFLAAQMYPERSPLKSAILRMQTPFPETPSIRLALDMSTKYGKEIWGHAGSTFGYKSFLGFEKNGHHGVVALSNGGEPDDIAHKVLRPEYRLTQYLPPPSFVHALEQRGYEAVIDVYMNMKKADGDFFLKEDVVNLWAYDLLGRDKNKEAIAIFSLAVYLWPLQANPYDSLAEAYEKVGDIENALVNYRKCVAIEATNEHAVGRLAKLLK